MRLSAELDSAASQAAYQDVARTVIPDILESRSLARLLKGTDAVPNWMQVTRLGGRHVMLDAAEMARIDASRRREFEAHVIAGARAGFQYLYETFPIYGKWHAGTLRTESAVLYDAFRFLNSEPFLDFMRTVTGQPEIGFADAQLTRYGPGHFLTRHDDSQDKGNRIAAFVLSLSGGWRADWGGQLQFLDGDHRVVDSFVPRCNTLSLFRVPQPHAVSYVAPYAVGHRISITGWLRAGADPGPDAVG